MGAWQERERWAGEKAFVSELSGGSHPSAFVSVPSSACLKALRGSSRPAGLCVSGPPPGLCTHHPLYLLHAPIFPHLTACATLFFRLSGTPASHWVRPPPTPRPASPEACPRPSWTDQFALHMSRCDPDH